MCGGGGGISPNKKLKFEMKLTSVKEYIYLCTLREVDACKCIPHFSTSGRVTRQLPSTVVLPLISYEVGRSCILCQQDVG